MPIRSIADLRGAVGKDWNDVSDEDLIKSYADSIKLDPVNVARELGYDVGTGGMAAKRLTSSVSNYVGGLQGVGEEIAGGLGLSGAQNYLAEKRRANELQAQVASSRARDMGAVESYKEVDTVGKGLNYLGGLVVQSFPYAIEAATGGLEARALMGGTRAALSEARAALVAGKAAGDATEVARATQAVKQAERSLDIGSEVGVAAQSYPSAVGDILQNQREQTGGKTDLGSAALYGAGYTGLNVMGVGGALGRGTLFRNTIDFLDRPGGITGGLARAGATAVGTGVKEGLSETGQEMFNQAGRMAVDDKAQFFDQEAQERYKESFVGGFALGGAMSTLGGYRRSEGYQAGNDVQQAFTQPQTSGTPITGQTPPAPPGTTVTAPPAPPNMPPGQTGAPITPPSAPAVVGGTTAVAQASQQQTQADFAAQQQQQIQDQREKVIDQFGLRGENPSVGQFFNRPIFGPAINQVADALAPIAAKLDQQEATVMNAIVEADKATGGKLVNFKFNGDKIAQSVQKGVEAVMAVANKFQIGHVGSAEEAAQILNTLSKSAKGAELEQINAIHQVLTGKDTEGYVTAQAPKPTKGKPNAQQQPKTTAGLGTVSEQGGTGQVNSGLTGLLQPGAVQPIGTGSDVGTAISQQAGQPSGEGIRPSPDIAADNGSPVLTPQVTGVPSETGTTIQDTVGGGQTSGQSIQANQSDVDRPVVQRRKRRAIIGAQQYAPGLQYYASDLSHISSPRRIEIIQQLLLSVLAPARDNTTSAETRAEIVRLALIEQFPMKEIAELTGIKLDTVSKQLQRMGIALKDGEFQVVRLLFAEKLVAQAEAFRSPEFPDGIGVIELKGLYATRYEGTEKPTGDLAEELEAGEQEGDRSKLLNEERFGGETGEGKSMGTIGSAGGSQGAVESDESTTLDKIEKLQAMLDAASDTDVAGKENVAKQLAAAWERYAKEQKDRAKAGETKVRYREEKAAELGETEGEEDAVQVESADEGDVQEPAGGGEKVGKANAEPKKPARTRKAKAESKPAEEAKPEIKTAEEQWTALAEQFPQMPPYATLNKDEKIRWDDVAERGVANLAAANTILSTVVKAAPAEKVEAPAAAGTTEAVEQPKFGVARAVKNPYTAAELMADIKNFIRADILGNKLIIVDSVSDLIRHPDADLRAVGKAVGDKGAYGVAANGKAYLIANRIEQGQGRAKFMHEVGAHLGLENLLPKMVYDKLASQIDTWAKADNGSVESQLAKAAQARVEAAQTSEEDRQSEMLAYFIEEAVQSGIDPTAAGKESAALQSWFRTLWAAFKVAIRRLGFKTETLTAQDIVNLAFGAARLEITGTWHGTAADFRKFSHAFMSSGEGAQAFGWGTYLAQRVGVAKGYWTEDVNRKTQGVKGLQIEPTNGVPLNRKEKMVLTQIEHGGVHHNGWKDELRNRYVPYWTKELAKAKDAYDWVKSGLPRGGRNNAEYYQGIISQLSELLNGTESLLAPGRAELRIEPKKVEGSLMRVDTSVSDSEMIDWDAPIANQPPIVKEFLADFLAEEITAPTNQIKTGGDIYKYLLAKFYRDAGNTGKWDYAEKQTKLEIKKAVSQYLDAHGIKGHKFFDQLSRNNGAVDVLAKRIANDEKFLATLKDRNADHWSEVTQAPMTEKARVATIKMVEKNIASLKNDLVKEQANRTQNTVIYNDKNIFRVGSETAADKQRMKFGFAGIKGVQTRGMTDKQVSNLTTAKLMDANGELRSDIWYDTGWLRGVDNQWRTEFSDKDAKMTLDKVEPNGKVQMGTVYRLGDILSHLPLYRLYPEIADYRVLFDANLAPGHAAFDSFNKLILMPEQQPDDVGVLLHEVQHAIQDIEGFGRGGSPENMDVYNVNAAEKFYRASPLFAKTDAQEVAIFKYYSAVEAFHNLEVLRNKMESSLSRYTLEERSKIRNAAGRADGNASIAFGEMLGKLGMSEYEVQKQMYSLISGEIEARDVEARREYNNELRRQVVPGEGEGINRDMQLVFDKSTGMYMSIGKTADQHAREQISKLPPKWQPAARTVTTTLMHTLKKAGLASMITEDVIGAATKYMKSAQNYLTAQYARQATRLAHELKIEKILQQHDKLPENLKGTGRGSVNEYIHDSTREGLWGYYPDARMVGTTMAKIDPGFKARFDAFPAAAQKLIKDVFEQGHDSLVAKQKAVTDAINREYADRAADVLGDADLTAELNKEKNLRIARESKLLGLDGSKPYAYMGRYGDYVVVGKSAEYKHHEAQAKSGPVVKGEYVYGSESQKWLEDNRSNPAHYVVQFAETLAEADQIAEQLNATGNYDIAESFEKEPYSREGGEMFAAVARLRNLYERESDGDNPAAAKAIRNLLGDLYLHTVSEASARKSEFQRLNISGSDKDMMRNLATRGRADAHFLAALQHNDAISDSITDMRQERDRNRREATPYFNELLKRHANSMKYETPSVLASALQRMSTVWYLSTNPAFYLQQILQTGTISLPYMAGRLGYFRSARAIKLAYSDMATLVKGLGVSEHVDFENAPADVRAMLKTLVGMGKIDIGIDSDSTARAGDTGVTAAVMQKLQGVNNRIETINRATAAIAAYRGYLERYKNNDTAAATKYAAEVVSNTHGSYDAFNTPRIMATGAGKVLLQFKRFQIIQISMLAKLLTTAFKGASAEEKTVARHSLAFIVGQMGVLGGLMAVPFAQQAASILSKIFGDPDEPDDWEFKLRRMIGDKAVADLLISGVPGAMGVDVSGKIGMGNVFSILPFTNIDFASRSGAEKMLVGLMGPSASLGLKFADGLGMMSQGDYYKGLEQMMPNGVANVLKSGRFATEGITMRNGDVVLKPEEISMLDAAFQAVGLPTNTITDRQFTQKVVKEFDQYYKQRDTEIKGDYVEASRKGDSAAMGDARDEWNKLQDSRVANGYKRQPYSDLFKAPMAANKRERNIAGGVEFGKSNRRFVESLSTI